MRVEGGCHCGAVRYEAECDEGDVAICHCEDCQKLTGTAFRTSVAARGAPRLLAGAPCVYVKTAPTGARIEQHFCGTCGSPLFVRSEGGDDWGLRWGGIDGREGLTPARAIWQRRAVPWLAEVPGLPGSAED
jgi:hypothetical protein